MDDDEEEVKRGSEEENVDDYDNWEDGDDDIGMPLSARMMAVMT